MTPTLQLSENENVWLMDDGTMQIFGIKICDTEAELGQGEIVGIQYPPEFVCQLMNFLNANYNLFFNDDISSGGEDDRQNEEWNPDDCDGSDDADIGTNEDPYSPNYEAD